MIGVVVAALVLSALLYLLLGFRGVGRPKRLGDLIPVRANEGAAVRSSVEFSASTAAASVSLATVVLAIFELTPYLGPWLLWTVVTTALGLVAVRVAAPRIWNKVHSYAGGLPTMHEFLAREYDAPILGRVGAVCTGLGFLGAFAVELTVGSRFLAALIPTIPTWLVTATLAGVGLAYTSAGGFRAVIVTDRIQMLGIWVLIVALGVYYGVQIEAAGVADALSKVPAQNYNLSPRDGLISFLVGIALINIPTFIADMSVWQRIAGSEAPQTVYRGLARSVGSVSLAWGALVILACLVPAVLKLEPEGNPLLPLVRQLGQPLTIFGGVVLFLVVHGLYAAMLSTASTQLIAISHTTYTDILQRRAPEGSAHNHGLLGVRAIIVLAGLVAVVVVEVLARFGMSIADLVFAIYGAQLGMCPVVVLALYLDRSRLRQLRWGATAGVALGFAGGWITAITGRLIGSSDLVFLAPVVSLGLSVAVLLVSLARKRARGGHR